MKYALIGCGRIATNHVKAALQNGLDIVAMCDLQKDKIEELLQKHGIRENQSIARYTDYKKMVDEHPELELIAIATSSGAHAEIALYCIAHHINVIIEKPMAMNMRDADKIVQLAKETHVKVCACHQNRFNLAVQKVRKAINEERLGKISHGTVHVRWNRGKEYYMQAPWRGTWAEDGGCLMNQCIHSIDMLRWMLGEEVVSVYGKIRQRQHDYLEAEDVGVAVVTFANGVIATLEGTTNVYPQNLEETLYIFGDKGTVKLGGKSMNNIDVWDFADERDEDKESRVLQEETVNVYGNGHTPLYADMIDAVQNDRQPYIDAIEGRNALEMVLAVYKSMKTGEAVRLPLSDFASIDMKGTFGK